ncbi:MAG: hypothetical protein ACFE0P_14525 [Oceanicaulis sp.]
MTRMRLLILAAAAASAAAGVAAGAWALMGGAVDQAVAFTWPGLAGAVSLALMAPGKTAD